MNILNEYKATTKLHSKSFKQIYMDWMHEKYLRNIQLHKRLAKWYRTACSRPPPPSYPIRSTRQHQFESIGGFSQHPNSSSDMYVERFLVVHFVQMSFQSAFNSGESHMTLISLSRSILTMHDC